MASLDSPGSQRRHVPFLAAVQPIPKGRFSFPAPSGRHGTAPSGFSGKLGSMRSLEYWPGDKTLAPEIFFATEATEFYALNAKTGKPVPGFGKEGLVNLKASEVMNGFPNMHFGVSSAPFIFRDLVITGSHLRQAQRWQLLCQRSIRRDP
jgi:hypothetical protein